MMDKLKATKQETKNVIKAKPETINFLMAYSKSLSITETKGHQFETNLN